MKWYVSKLATYLHSRLVSNHLVVAVTLHPSVVSLVQAVQSRQREMPEATSHAYSGRLGYRCLGWKVVFEPHRHDTCWTSLFPGEMIAPSQSWQLVYSPVRMDSGDFPSHIAYTLADDADHHVTVQSCVRLSYSPSTCSKGF